MFYITLIQRTLFFNKIFLSTLPISVLNVRSELSCELSSSELNWAWIASWKRRAIIYPKAWQKLAGKAYSKPAASKTHSQTWHWTWKCVCVLIDFFPPWIPARPFTSPLHPKNAYTILVLFPFENKTENAFSLLIYCTKSDSERTARYFTS